jgi:hypothetical protein
MKAPKSLFLFVLILPALACSLTSQPAEEIVRSTSVPNQNLTQTKISGAVVAAPEDEPKNTPKMCQVNAQILNLRECPGIECKVIDWLYAGDKLVILNTLDTWLKVETQGRKIGWINGKYCGGKP